MTTSSIRVIFNFKEVVIAKFIYTASSWCGVSLGAVEERAALSV